MGEGGWREYSAPPGMTLLRLHTLKMPNTCPPHRCHLHPAPHSEAGDKGNDNLIFLGSPGWTMPYHGVCGGGKPGGLRPAVSFSIAGSLLKRHPEVMGKAEEAARRGRGTGEPGGGAGRKRVCSFNNHSFIQLIIYRAHGVPGTVQGTVETAVSKANCPSSQSYKPVEPE